MDIFQANYYKDSRMYLTAHFLCSELGILLWASIVIFPMIIWDNVLLPASIFFIIITIFFIFLKFFGMIFYYKYFFKNVQGSIVAKLINSLRDNKNNSRMIFLLVVTLYYIGSTLFNVIMTPYARMLKLTEGICFLYIVSSFLPYKMLFYYWDMLDYKQKDDVNICSCIKFLLKKSWVFILVSILIFVFDLILMKIYPYT